MTPILANRGRPLESLVLASQTDVLVTKMPLAARYIGGGKLIRQSSPVDFFGLFKSSGKLIVFDAKQNESPTRLETSPSHLPEHQRLELCRYGDAGAIAGILAECTTTRTLYWFPWTLLRTRRPSIAWAEAALLGSSGMAVQWRRIYSAMEFTVEAVR